MAKRKIKKSTTPVVESLLVTDSFIYEISLYKIYKDRVELAGSQFYSANKKLSIKKETVYKKVKDCVFMKCIEWVAAPRDFIKENNLNAIIPCRKLRKRKKIT